LNEYLFPNGQRTLAQRFGFLIFASLTIKNSQVVERGRHLHQPEYIT